MKRNFKLLVAVVALVAMVFTLASCDVLQGIIGGNDPQPQPHEHQFSAEWSSDETNHWHASTCEDGEECATATSDLAAHTIEDGVCSVCGYEAPVEEHVHNFVEGKCECGEEDPDYVPVCKDHQYTSSETKAPTCTEAGEKTFTCSVCGDSFTQEIAPNDHTEEKIPAVAPTCTKPGLSEGKKCSVCDVIIKAPAEINALGHTFVEGTCSACGEVDPEYNGPKTYVLDVQTLTAFAEGKKADGDSEVVVDFYTIYYSAKTKIDSTKDKVWEDGYTVNPGLRLNFGGTTGIGETTKNTIKIVVDGTATIKVWWVAGGNGREVGIYDENGELVTASYSPSEAWTETVDGVEHSGSNAKKNALYLSKFEISKPGTYYIGTDNTLASKKGGNIFFKVETVVTPIEKKEIAATTTDNYCWVDKVTFTADAEGEYTFLLPAGLGAWDAHAYDTDYFSTPYVDSLDIEKYDPEAEHKFTVALEAGESYEFYIAALTKQDWKIEYTFEACEVEDESGSEGGDGTDTPAVLDGVYTGHSMYNDNITVTFNPMLGCVTFAQGDYSTVCLYEVKDGAVVLYKNDGSGEEWNSMFYAITLGENGAPVSAVYNGNTFELVAGEGDSGEDVVLDLEGSYVDADGILSVTITDTTVTFVHTNGMTGYVTTLVFNYTIEDGKVVLTNEDGSSVPAMYGIIVTDGVVTGALYEAWDYALTEETTTPDQPDQPDQPGEGGEGGEGGETTTPDGSYEAPIILEALPYEGVASITGSWGGAYYFSFTATAEGFLTINASTDNAVDLSINDRYENTVKIPVLAGQTYIVNVYNGAPADIAVSMSFEAATLTENDYKEIINNTYASTEDYSWSVSLNKSESGVYYANVNGGSWDAPQNHYYAYSVSFNEDGSVLIVLGDLLDLSAEYMENTGAEYAKANGYNLLLTKGEYGYTLSFVSAQ